MPLANVREHDETKCTTCLPEVLRHGIFEASELLAHALLVGSDRVDELVHRQRDCGWLTCNATSACFKILHVNLTMKLFQHVLYDLHHLILHVVHKSLLLF